MNNQRRKKLKIIMEKIIALREEVQSICDEEQEAFDNMPYSLQQSARGVAIDDGMEVLNSIGEWLESAEDGIKNFVGE